MTDTTTGACRSAVAAIILTIVAFTAPLASQFEPNPAVWLETTENPIASEYFLLFADGFDADALAHQLAADLNLATGIPPTARSKAWKPPCCH